MYNKTIKSGSVHNAQGKSMALDSFDPNTSGTKGRHAGDMNGGREIPLREYRDTPLETAIANEDVAVPETYEEGFQHVPFTEMERIELERFRAEKAAQIEAKRAAATERSGSRKGIHRTIAAVAGGALALAGVFTAVKAANNDNKPPEPQVNNSAAPFPRESEPAEAVVEVPPEARDFVALHPDDYVDPVATYYAEEAYIASNEGLRSVLDAEYVATYEFPTIASGETSPLWGLNAMRLAPGTPITNETFTELLNTAALPNIERALNLMAKNPNSPAIEVVDNEFRIYCGSSNPNFDILLSTLTAITAKYGSAATYEVAPASNDDSDPNATLVSELNTPTIDSVDEEGNILAFSNTIRLNITVTTYNDKNEPTVYTETLDNLELHFTYDPVTGPAETAPGYISIGQQ